MPRLPVLCRQPIKELAFKRQPVSLQQLPPTHRRQLLKRLPIRGVDVRVIAQPRIHIRIPVRVVVRELLRVHHPVHKETLHPQGPAAPRVTPRPHLRPALLNHRRLRRAGARHNLQRRAHREGDELVKHNPVILRREILHRITLALAMPRLNDTAIRELRHLVPTQIPPAQDRLHLPRHIPQMRLVQLLERPPQQQTVQIRNPERIPIQPPPQRMTLPRPRRPAKQHPLRPPCRFEKLHLLRHRTKQPPVRRPHRPRHLPLPTPRPATPPRPPHPTLLRPKQRIPTPAALRQRRRQRLHRARPNHPH